MSDLPPLRMDAYYYGFNETGVRAVDEILSAVAVAGKAYHHTDGWTEPRFGADDERSYVDAIQDAAGRAASVIRQREEAIRNVREITDRMEKMPSRYGLAGDFDTEVWANSKDVLAFVAELRKAIEG